MTSTGSSNGGPIQDFSGNDTDSQKWLIQRAKSGTTYVISNKGTGDFVDLLNGNPDNGAAINSWAGSGVSTIDNNTHQLWLVIHA